jgi:phospholipid/cholesterol/gamma-HCH transport system ATP-binding protein
MGLSGVGKSTTLRCIIGLQKPTSGNVYVFGKNIVHSNEAQMNELRRRISMVFQQPALFDSMTVGDNVAFPLRERRQHREEEIQRIVAEKLKLVDLDEMEHLFPAQLSGGMQKRVSIARAITTDPELILYDEPTSGLDPIISSVINEMARNLQRKLKATSIVVTHDLHSATTIADSIAFLFAGGIVWQGTPEEFKNSNNAYVEQFRNGSTRGPIQV